MARTYDIIDADGHVLEPVDLWDKYLDPGYRDRAPRMIIDTDGKERLLVEGQVLGSKKGFNVVGAIGSRANSSKRRERLMKHFDMTADEVDRLHGPIGLNLGGKTPPEIAVSILAEMTAVRHGASLQRADKGTVFAQSQDPFACSAAA